MVIFHSYVCLLEGSLEIPALAMEVYSYGRTNDSWGNFQQAMELITRGYMEIHCCSYSIYSSYIPLIYTFYIPIID